MYPIGVPITQITLNEIDRAHFSATSEFKPIDGPSVCKRKECLVSHFLYESAKLH